MGGYPSPWSQVPAQPLVPCPLQGVPPSSVTGPVQSPVPGPAGGWGYPSQERTGYPPPARTGGSPQTGEQVMLRRGRYTSCGQAGGLSCLEIFCCGSKLAAIYTERHPECSVNTTMVLAILLSLKTIKLRQNGNATPFWSNFIVFHESSVSSVIAVLTLH